MNLIVYVNEVFEDERALFDLVNEKTLLKGDEHHDSISEKIEGYIEALNDFNIYNDEVKTKWIDESHKHHRQIDFYKR